MPINICYSCVSTGEVIDSYGNIWPCYNCDGDSIKVPKETAARLRELARQMAENYKRTGDYERALFGPPE